MLSGFVLESDVLLVLPYVSAIRERVIMQSNSCHLDLKDSRSATAERESAVRPDLSVVIVAFDSLSFLRDCLSSIPSGAGRFSHEVIVVDNASSDGTAAWLSRAEPSLRAVCNRQNLGFARACNQGILAARGRYLLLLNPDTVVGDRALERTVEFLSAHRRLAAATCKIVRPGGQLDPSCKRDFPNLWDAFSRFSGLSRLLPRSRIFARYDARYLDDDVAQEVPLIDGCFMLMRHEAVEDIGLFDERFFMYAEEMDWCRRARLKGWSIGYDPSGITMHVKGAATRRHTFRMLYHFHRSMGVYYWKHGRYRGPGMFLVLPALTLRLLILLAINACRRNRRVSG